MSDDPLAVDMRKSFEASLPLRLGRSSRVKLQNVIPSHWFSAAASECHGMFIAGHFYGTISVAQAYVESLSKFLCDTYNFRGNQNDAAKRWSKLLAEKIIGPAALEAALAVLSDRNDFHHLNKAVEQEYAKLEKRAEDCVNLLYTIESDVFAHSFHAGSIVPQRPERWPDSGDGLTRANLRQKW